MKKIKADIVSIFNAYTGEQNSNLDSRYQSLINDLFNRGIENSTIAENAIANLYVDALKIRIAKSWDLTKKYFERHDIDFFKKEAIEIGQFLKSLIESKEKRLLNDFEGRLNVHRFVTGYYEGVRHALGRSRNQLITEIQSELNLYVERLSLVERKIKRIKKYCYNHRGLSFFIIFFIVIGAIYKWFKKISGVFESIVESLF